MSFSHRYFETLIRYRHAFNFVIIALTIVSVIAASRLKLKTDFAELLPEKLSSVIALNKAAERTGGTANLFIGIESPNFEANANFVDALAERLNPWVGTRLRYFEYRYLDVQTFLETFGLHYLSTDQLKKMRLDLEEEIERKKDSAIGLGLEETDSSIKKKKEPWLSQVDPRLGNFLNYKEAYLSSNDGNVLVMSLKVLGSGLKISGSRELVSDIQKTIESLDPRSFDPQLRTFLVGGVMNTIREYDTIRSDIADTALLLVALIISILFLFFWSIRSIVLLSLNLIFAVTWTFALTKWHIGYLNTQTAFLGSLVVGTGINYGIIFLSRYFELRRSGLELIAAIQESIDKTAIATLIATSTTACAFLSLLLADNKGLTQFGFIGCIGVGFCWVAAYSLLPLWLYQWENLWPSPDVHNPLGSRCKKFGEGLGQWITNHAISFSIIFAGVSVICSFGVYHLVSNPTEYDFNKLRNRVAKSEAIRADERKVYAAFSQSSTPAIVLFEKLDEAQEYCSRVKEVQSALPKEKNIIKSCMTIFELLPDAIDAKEVPERQALFSEIRRLTGDKTLYFSKDGQRIKRVHQLMKDDLPTLNDLPDQLSRRFAEKNGARGLIGFVYPDSEKPLDDGHNLIAFTDSLRNIHLTKTNTIISAAGDSFILADLLRGLKHDAPIVSAVAFGGVFLIAIFLAGGLMAGIFMALCLATGTWWLLGFQGFFDLKYNFFNFIALPLTFGIGVDYPINVFVRCRQEGFKNYGKILATSGTAVLLCSLTTIIGYYTLFGASNQALVSFAKIAFIGEFTCLAAALFVVPVTLRLFGKFRNK